MKDRNASSRPIETIALPIPGSKPYAGISHVMLDTKDGRVAGYRLRVDNGAARYASVEALQQALEPVLYTGHKTHNLYPDFQPGILVTTERGSEQDYTIGLHTLHILGFLWGAKRAGAIDADYVHPTYSMQETARVIRGDPEMQKKIPPRQFDGVHARASQLEREGKESFERTLAAERRAQHKNPKAGKLWDL